MDNHKAEQIDSLIGTVLRRFPIYEEILEMHDYSKPVVMFLLIDMIAAKVSDSTENKELQTISMLTLKVAMKDTFKLSSNDMKQIEAIHNYVNINFDRIMKKMLSQNNLI